MKKLIIFVSLIVGMLTVQNSHAQVDVTINPFGILFGDLSLGADFIISENFSLEGTIGLGSYNEDNFTSSSIGVNGVGKYYFNPVRGGDRFYVSAFLRFISRNWNYSDNSGFADFSRTRMGLGFGLGYKIVAKKGFVFDIGFGFGRAIFTSKYRYKDSSGTNITDDWLPVIALGKLGVGYRFGQNKNQKK